MAKNVIFKKIELKNFKSHELLDLEFTPNRFVSISGPNGSGKSSLAADAICVALYDKTTNGRSGDDYIRKRTGKNCVVTLTFSIDNDEYRIENYRKHKDHSNNKYLFKVNPGDEEDTDITRSTRKDTNKFIEEMIMPFDIFCNCLLFSQFINKPFASLGNAGQHDILDTLLNLNKYDEYLEKTKENIKELESTVGHVEGKISLIQEKISFVNETIETTTQETEQKYIQFNTRKTEIETEVEELRKTFTNKKQSINLYKLSKKKLDKANSKLLNVQSKLNNIEAEFKNKAEACKNEKRSEYTTKESEIREEKRGILEEYDTIIKDSNVKLKNVSDSIHNRHGKIETELKHEKINLTHKYQDYVKPITESIYDYKIEKNQEHQQFLIKERDRKLLEEQLKELDDQLDSKVIICPECNQEVKDPEHKKKILKNKKELENQIKNLKIQSFNHTKQENLCDREIEKNDKIIEKADARLKEVKIEIENKIKENDKSIKDEITTESDDIQQDIYIKTGLIKALNEGIVHAIERLKESTRNELNELIQTISTDYNNKVISFNKDKKETQSEIEKLEDQTNTLEAEVRRVETTQALIKEKIESIDVITTDIKSLYDSTEKKILILNTNIGSFKEEIKKINQENKDDLEKINILKFWKTAFGSTGIKSIILDESMPILNKYAREFCKELTDLKISFSSQTMLKNGEMRNKFNINVLQTKNLSGFEDLSAGEKRMVNIIVLLCLRKLLETMSGVKLNIIILDEILDNLDEDNSTIAIRFIQKLAVDNCVLFITHTLGDYVEADDYIKF